MGCILYRLVTASDRVALRGAGGGSGGMILPVGFVM